MINIPAVFWLVPVASLVALSMAWFFFRQMMAADEGTPRMKEIALYVRKGAMAYLKSERTEPMGALCLPHRWFLLRSGWFLRHEDRHLCFCPYGECCA